MSLLTITVTPFRRNRVVEALTKSWGPRRRALMAYLPYLAAQQVLEQVRGKLPVSDDLKGYRDGLTLTQITGLPPEVYGSAISVKPRSKRIREVDSNRVVLYIRPRRKLARTKPEIEILEKYSPWTMNTIPFMPLKRHALIVTRQVSQREVDAVTKQRKQDRSAWRRELAGVGARETRKDKRVTVPKTSRAIPDVAFQGLRLEFGLGGMKGIPHWRPGLRSFFQGVRSLIRRHPSIKYALTRPSFRGWESWPPRASRTLQVSRVRKFDQFQKKLNVRA